MGRGRVPAVAHLARQVSGPLALVDLGPSAGLNLLLDRYEYNYDGCVVGSVSSPVTVHSELRGERHRALGVAREDPPRVVEGDLLEELPAVLDSVYCSCFPG